MPSLEPCRCPNAKLHCRTRSNACAAQQKARAALINRLAPACVTKQETGSFYTTPLSRRHRWSISLLLPNKSQTLPKAKDTTKSATERRSKILFAEQAGILELPHARSCCTTEACKILLLFLLSLVRCKSCPCKSITMTQGTTATLVQAPTKTRQAVCVTIFMRLQRR